MPTTPTNCETCTPEELAIVEELGGLGFTATEIAIILTTEALDVQTTRLKGFLTSAYKVRKANYELALQGNSASIILHLKILDEAKLAETLQAIHS